jgi:glycosyltransferase involved in cell wall biosynthesis
MGPARDGPLPTVAIDYRPALHNREGIGRVAREAVRALVARDDAPELVLVGAALRAPRVGPLERGLPTDRNARVRLVAPRLPARLTAPLLRLAGGVDRLLGAGLVQHTQLLPLPSARAPSTGFVFDLLFEGGGSGHLAARAARTMEARLDALLPRLARIQVTSTWVRDALVERRGIAAQRIDMVTLGGDHVLRAPRVPRDDVRLPRGPYVLTVARLDPRKGHTLALAAFERLVARGWHGTWVVAGPPGHRAEELAAALAASPASARIEWRRAVDEGQLAALLQHAEAFVFPSLAEGFGLPPIEAMWAGAPVVTSRATCLAEIVGSGADTFDPAARDAVDELDARLERVLSDGGYREALRARGAAWCRRHSWAHCAEGLVTSWRAALSE